MSESELHYGSPCKKTRLDFDRETFGCTNYSADDDNSLESLESVSKVENVNVHLRLRPIRNAERNYRLIDRNKIVASNHNAHNELVEKHFTFTSVMDGPTSQKDIYTNVVYPLLKEPIMDATILCYGCSGSGKTHTIQGELNEPGLVPRAIVQVFTEYNNNINIGGPFAKVVNNNIKFLSDEESDLERYATLDFLEENRKLNVNNPIPEFNKSHIDSIIQQHSFIEKPTSNDCKMGICIWISFVEIYNEKFIDLLQPKSQFVGTTGRQLKIFSNNKNSYICGLTSLFVENISQAMKVLQYGRRKVNYASTDINAKSSRSHSIFFLTILSEQNSIMKFSTFKFCDLAGAERIKKAGNAGDRLKEAGSINNSLMVLGRCLEIVSQNQKLSKKSNETLVPVRDSKLTFLLQSSLIGNEKFIMVVNIFPKIEFFEENLTVLHFASIAKEIKIKKQEVQKQLNRSTRFSFFTKYALNTKINSSTISDNNMFYSSDESLNDGSMSDLSSSDLIEKLQIQLRRKEREAMLYRQHTFDITKEHFKNEMEWKKKYDEIRLELASEYKRKIDDINAAGKYFLNTKMDIANKLHENEISEMESYIEELEAENEKLKNENSQLRSCLKLNGDVVDAEEINKDNAVDDDDDVNEICDDEDDDNSDVNASVETIDSD